MVLWGRRARQTAITRRQRVAQQPIPLGEVNATHLLAGPISMGRRWLVMHKALTRRVALNRSCIQRRCLWKNDSVCREKLSRGMADRRQNALTKQRRVDHLISNQIVKLLDSACLARVGSIDICVSKEALQLWS